METNQLDCGRVGVGKEIERIGDDWTFLIGKFKIEKLSLVREGISIRE
jgi:hypothetical protein